eukprot:563848-Rhodomonas_salina.1
MAGTDVGLRGEMHGTDTWILLACYEKSAVCCYACYDMSGTEVGDTARTGARCGVVNVDQYYGLACPRNRAQVQRPCVHCVIGLRAYYAMFGTDEAYGAIGLRAPYAMSGTDGAYGATSGNQQRMPLSLRRYARDRYAATGCPATRLRLRYAMFAMRLPTDVGYAATN